MLFAIVAIAAFSGETAMTLNELAKGLITELIGFGFTAAVLGYLLASESREREKRLASESNEREKRYASERELVLLRQVRHTQELMRPLRLAGTAFGPQYLRQVQHLTDALDNLAADLDAQTKLAKEEDERRTLTAIMQDVRALKDAANPVVDLLETVDHPVQAPEAFAAALTTASASLGHLAKKST